MKLLVNYVDFHPDNHQGGSGKSFEFEVMIEIKEPCSDVWDEIHGELKPIVERQRPFQVGGVNNYVIQKVTLL